MVDEDKEDTEEYQKIEEEYNNVVEKSKNCKKRKRINRKFFNISLYQTMGRKLLNNTQMTRFSTMKNLICMFGVSLITEQHGRMF